MCAVDDLNEILGELGEPPATQDELQSLGFTCIDCGALLPPCLVSLASLRCHDHRSRGRYYL